MKAAFLGEKSANDGPNDPEKEHRHLLCSEIGIGAGVYGDWLKCKNLKVGRGYWQGQSPQGAEKSMLPFASVLTQLSLSGYVACCGSPSRISYQGALLRTQMWYVSF